MNKAFLDDNFLLNNAAAERLYHDFAKGLPIIDYHNHLPPAEISDDKQYENITQVWLKGDHYKWRAMRANGIDEKYITGDASDKDKFLQWAKTVPYTLRNPLYHWTHLELRRYFDIDDLLNGKSAERIYEQANQQLQNGFSAKKMLQKMRVEVVCTTDEPTDDLNAHFKQQKTGDNLKMLPTFRPDKFILINGSDFSVKTKELAEIVGNEINTFADLVNALANRIEFFHAAGCRLSDHGLSQLFAVDFTEKELDDILKKKKENKRITAQETAAFQTGLLYELGKIYCEKDWTMQLHLGAIRNNNSRLLRSVGGDVGADSIGDYAQAEGLAFLLNRLDNEGKLTKTILYNLNPRDNELFAAMAGNFNGGSIPGKIQWGSAWWFLDQKDGMEKQINALSNMGLLSRFVGMLTDSRSFLSFPRHEYFRRILCNLIGQDVKRGELPADFELLGKMTTDICYGNAKRYFDF